jgi:hypothetical protein
MVSSTDHRDYRSYLLDYHATTCFGNIKKLVDEEVADCEKIERNTGQPPAGVKSFRKAQLRPEALLYNVPTREVLQKKFRALSKDDWSNYHAIFERCQQLLHEIFKGYYEEALLLSEEIKTVGESRILQQQIVARLPEIRTRQASLEFPAKL